MSAKTASAQEAPRQESLTLKIDGKHYREYDLPDDEHPPATNHLRQVVTVCFLDGQHYAGTCGRFFGTVSREATVYDCAEIARTGQAFKDTDGTGALRVGVISLEWLRNQGAKFRVKELIRDSPQ